jgi:hypothetical protein
MLAAVLAVLGSAPAIGAAEGDDRRAAETASATDPESGGNVAESSTEPTKAKKAKKGPPVIVVPIFITEPAIGYGLGGAVGYFHKKPGDESPGSLALAYTADTAGKAGKRQKVPPTISGVAVAYTEKGTWAAGLAHSASWRRDTMRYTGAVGYAHIVSRFYFGDQPFDFKLDTGLLYQDLEFRIRSSNFFVGGKLLYLRPDLIFDDGLEEIPEVSEQTQLNDFGLALQGNWDIRDNKMTPNRGQLVELEGWRHLEALGGETDYWKIGLVADSFHEFAEGKLVLGLHLDLDTAGGDPPFWGYPWITMRGIPALRYQNESTAVVASELRWNLAERWAAVGFIGVGATRGDTQLFKDESGVVAGGLGGRYLYRPQDSLWVGVDLARGPEDWVVYVVAGHKW